MGLFGFGKKKEESPQNVVRFDGGLQQVKFAVPYFDVFDPRFENYGVPVAIRGAISFRIANLQEFNEIHKTDSMDIESFKSMIQTSLKKYVKAVVSNCPSENNIPVVTMDKKILQITDLVEQFIQDRLLKEFGVTVTSVDIGDIDVDKTSEGYKSLVKVTKDIEEKRVATDANIENAKKVARAEMEIDNMQNTQMSGAASSSGSSSGETWSTGGASSSSGASNNSASAESWS